MISIHAGFAAGMILFTGIGAICAWMVDMARFNLQLRSNPTMAGGVAALRTPKAALSFLGTGWMVLMTIAMINVTHGDGQGLAGEGWGFMLVMAAPASMAMDALVAGRQTTQGTALHRALCMIAMGACTIFVHTGHGNQEIIGHHGAHGSYSLPLILIVCGAYIAYSLKCGLRMTRGAARGNGSYAHAGEIISGAGGLLCMLFMAVA